MENVRLFLDVIGVFLLHVVSIFLMLFGEISQQLHDDPIQVGGKNKNIGFC